MKRHGDANVSFEFDALSQAWSGAGRKLRQPGTYVCVVSDCRSLAYVALKTATGNRPVCFRHYALIDEYNDIAG